MIKELQVHSFSLRDDKSPVVQQVLFPSIIISPSQDPPVTFPVGSEDVCAPLGAGAGAEDTQPGAVQLPWPPPTPQRSRGCSCLVGPDWNSSIPPCKNLYWFSKLQASNKKIKFLALATELAPRASFCLCNGKKQGVNYTCRCKSHWLHRQNHWF